MRHSYIFWVLTMAAASFTVVADADSLSELQQAKIAMRTDLDAAEKHIEKALAKASNNAEVQFICGRIMGQQAISAIAEG